MITICDFEVQGKYIIVTKPSYVTTLYKCKVPFLEKAYKVSSTEAIIKYELDGIVVTIPRSKEKVRLKILKEYEKKVLDLNKMRKLQVADFDAKKMYTMYWGVFHSGYYVVPHYKQFAFIEIDDKKYEPVSSFFLPAGAEVRLATKEQPLPYKLYDYLCVQKSCREVLLATDSCIPNEYVVKLFGKYYLINGTFPSKHACVEYLSLTGQPVYLKDMPDFGINQYTSLHTKELVGGIGLILIIILFILFLYRVLLRKKRKRIIMVGKHKLDENLEY